MKTKEFILQSLRESKPELSKFGVQSIGLFGSYSRGEQRADSNINILIDFAPGQTTFDNFMAIYDFVEDIFKEEKVEIVTKGGLSKYIGPDILKEVIYV